ncbi:ABC transporter substrate-binding protein [Streptomyces cellulosae]
MTVARTADRRTLTHLINPSHPCDRRHGVCAHGHERSVRRPPPHPCPRPSRPHPRQVRLGRTPGRVRLVAAAGAAALALSAGLATPLSPAPSQAHAADDDGKVLTVAEAQSVDSLSPFLAVRLLSTSIHRLTYEYLTNYDPEDNHVVPGLATTWESSPDKLTWTYTIRSDSTWSDGEQATAEDAAWTFNTMMTDPGAATANGSFVSNFEKVTAPSPTQLVIKLKKPQATMTALDVPIVPKHVWKKGSDYLTTARAKGLRDDLVRRRHAVPNALLPTVTLIFINLGRTVAGVILVETVFSWPGLGGLFYQALSVPDLPLVQGLFFVFAAAVIVMNTLADLIYPLLGPRVGR